MLSNTCKYAIRALIYLAKNGKDGKKIGIKRISEDLTIPSPFLGKILQSLAKQKVLVSTKGPHGGFGMGMSPDEIRLYDIVHIIDGDDFFTNCLIGMEPCNNTSEAAHRCPVHSRFSPIKKEITNLFMETTITSILEDMDEENEFIRL
ncbi:Rrf2 family transcriptional regulator [Prolixibacteraceae bacterium JC049]|nr:Rrf2 family transcriptional regulator [Prolixibacteraceae bacterium JC049]